MKLFNPKEASEIARLKDENEELRNTVHQMLIKQDGFDTLEKRIAEKTEKLSELSKEEQRIIDFLQNSTDEKVAKSKAVFELNNKIEELTQQQFDLNESVKTISETNESLLAIKEKSENEVNFLSINIEEKKSELFGIEEKLNILNNNANRLTEEILRGESKVENLIKAENELVENIAKNKLQIEEFEKIALEKENIKAKAEIESDTISQSLSILVEKRDVLINELENINSKLEKTKLEHESILEQFKNDESIRRNMQTNIAELISELNSKEKIFREYEVKKNEFVDEISKKRNELDSVNFEIVSRNERLAEIDKENELLIQQKREIELNIENKKIISEEIERELIRKREEVSSFDEQINEAKNEITNCEERKFKVEENILKMESHFADATKVFAEEINEAKIKLNSIKQLIIDKDRDFNKKEQIFLERNTQLAEYTGMVRMLRKEKDSVENMLRDLQIEKNQVTEKLIALKEKESEAKLTIEKYNSEIRDLVHKREGISYELSNILNESSKSYAEFHQKSEMLNQEIIQKEETIHELSENISDLELGMQKLKEDIAKAEMEKEDHSTKIAQLITMEKTFHAKVETYKKELERIEEETIIDEAEPIIKIMSNSKNKEKRELESNN